jgi:hypothetical protein
LSQVVDCSLFCDEHGPVESLLGPNPPPPVLFALKKLSLTFRVLHGGLWEYFAAPKLEDLTITSLSDDDERAWDNDEFTSFRARSAFFVLTTLRLQFDFTDDVDTMIELLRSLYALDGLVLHWTTPRQEASSDIKRLLHYLAFHPCHSLTLPKLRYIEVDATVDSLNMLRSRCPPKTGLAGVTLYERAPFDSETVFREEIEGLRRNGVRVEVEPMDFYGAHDVP